MAKRAANQHPERTRLEREAKREANWKRWGPYLPERQWGTVREDYSPHGDPWGDFPHDHARSRAYRWGEDGLLGWTDRECRLCFSLCLWNGEDAILKERLYGLTGPEGNHGEDVKELYYYLDALPTYAYAKALYKYPQVAFPYAELVERNRRRGLHDREYELLDTDSFDEDAYFDVFIEYAKASPDDTLMRIVAHNRGPTRASLHLAPLLWYRNTWSWGCAHEGCTLRPVIRSSGDHAVTADHETLGRFHWDAGVASDGTEPTLLFTENHTNQSKLYGVDNDTPYVRDAFHRYLIQGDEDAVNPDRTGTRVCAWYPLEIAAGGEVSVELRLRSDQDAGDPPFGDGFDATLEDRREECRTYYESITPALPEESLDESDARRMSRQAYAGLLWSKQFYHYIVEDWLAGDPNMPPPVPHRAGDRNADWKHLFNRDVISMPDKWEYPWYAAWDLAFHMIPMAKVDPTFAKQQLILFLREWYLHPNGQLPAYEYNFSDVNPPVHAWACWEVFRITGSNDHRFLASAFQKLLLNFTWWVNRKDPHGHHLFSGGFLGLDNIGLFDRSRPMPSGRRLIQADGTAWMAFYCATMLTIALELASVDPVYEDMASKFFEHYTAIADAINSLGGSGLWHAEDGFYYDQITCSGWSSQLRVRSMVGLLPLIAVSVLDRSRVDALPGFRKRMDWFIRNRPDLSKRISYLAQADGEDATEASKWLLALPTEGQLRRVLARLFDPAEFLSPFGVRSLSRYHAEHPVHMNLDGEDHWIRYEPGESETPMFGGNSNWRGPVWFPLNYLLIEALRAYHDFYGDEFKVPVPTGSETEMTLDEAANEIGRRLTRLVLRDGEGRRAAHGEDRRYIDDPHFRDLTLFYEFFDGDTGRGCGASHQTGWTALAATCVEDLARRG